jgi:endonuclease III
MAKTSHTNLQKLLAGLRKQWPVTRCELNFANPLQLMIGTILSAQSTDKRVNEITPALFRKYPSAQAFAKANPAELENDIRSTGFFRSKTRSIRGACQVLMERFGGKLPKTMDELLELPGIGRKSANVILGAAFGIPSGIVVDTHMTRLAERLQLSAHQDPAKIERDLNALVPPAHWIFFSQAMVLHGRYICVARKPRCWECELIKICPYPDKELAPSDAEPPVERKTITGIPILPSPALRAPSPKKGEGLS